ncbi:hypothetical protein BDZ89DRAFT_1220289 [Hymenopellis radicata]|nr:hypothetical protein BDZ89DRAFT_1220289 [Hymenopellis radicata]
MSIVHDDLVHVAIDNGAGQRTTLDAVTLSDARENSTSTDYDGLVGPEDVNDEVRLGIDGSDDVNANNENVPADDNPSLPSVKASKAQMSAIPAESKPPSRRNSAFTEPAPKASLPIFTARGAYRYYQTPTTGMQLLQLHQSYEVARFPAASWGLEKASQQRKATGNDMTRRAKGKKKAGPSSGDLPPYKYVIPPLPPCLSELAPYQALYEFPHPYTPNIMVPVLMQWIDIHRTPSFPEELDLVFVVCWKVPEERVPRVLEFMQRPPLESLWQ